MPARADLVDFPPRRTPDHPFRRTSDATERHGFSPLSLRRPEGDPPERDQGRAHAGSGAAPAAVGAVGAGARPDGRRRRADELAARGCRPGRRRHRPRHPARPGALSRRRPAGRPRPGERGRPPGAPVSLDRARVLGPPARLRRRLAAALRRRRHHRPPAEDLDLPGRRQRRDPRLLGRVHRRLRRPADRPRPSTTPRSSSSATASRRPSTTGTTSRGPTSRARSC